jgi:hypothetical protein
VKNRPLRDLAADPTIMEREVERIREILSKKKRGGFAMATAAALIVDADTFLTRLAKMVNALGQGARAHPQSVAGALALAKKYCRDDKFDAEWHEFLSEEVAKFRTFVTGPAG